MLLIAWFGARLIVQSGNDPVKGMSTGQLMSLINYSMQILMSLMMLSMVFVMITMSRASMERIVEILKEESDLKNGVDPVMQVADGSVVFDHVSFSYAGGNGKRCLKNINLNIPSGSTVGIIGGTGTSKSTLVQLIPRLPGPAPAHRHRPGRCGRSASHEELIAKRGNYYQLYTGAFELE